MLYNIVLVSAVQCEPANMCVYICLVASVVSDSLRPYGPWPARLLCPWNSPGMNTGVDWHALLQRIFPSQGLNKPGYPAVQAESLLSEPQHTIHHHKE